MPNAYGVANTANINLFGIFYFIIWFMILAFIFCIILSYCSIISASCGYAGTQTISSFRSWMTYGFSNYCYGQSNINCNTGGFGTSSVPVNNNWWLWWAYLFSNNNGNNFMNNMNVNGVR